MPISRRDRQPDFQALFFEHFGPVARRHSYELRFGTSNLLHDVVFLSSLVHDARFRPEGMRHQGARLVVDLVRDTWETGGLSRPTGLHYIASRLSIRGVANAEWRLQRGPLASTEELEISTLSLEHCGDDTGHWRLGFHGYEWQYFLTLNDDSAAVALRDTGDPQSHKKPPRAVAQPVVAADAPKAARR